MTEIVGGNVGAVGKYDVKFENKQLVLVVGAAHGAIAADISVKIDAGLVLDAIAAAIPGKIDDSVINLIKTALLGG